MKVICPHCNQEIEIETPEVSRRGKLQGLTLSEMSDDQLKREITNAKSVLYKAEKRNASEDVILRNKDRVDAALAEKAKRDAENKDTEEAPANVAEDVENSVYEED